MAAFQSAATAKEMLEVLDRARPVLDRMQHFDDQEPCRRCAAARDAARALHMAPPPPKGLPFLDGGGAAAPRLRPGPDETDIVVWIMAWAKALRGCPSIAAARAFRDANAPHLAEVASSAPSTRKSCAR